MSRSKSPVRETAESFICVNCGATVPPTEHGTANRNHCPRCLHSLHVDLRPRHEQYQQHEQPSNNA